MVKKLQKLKKICDRFRIKCSTIGHVTKNKMMHVKDGQKTIAHLPAEFVARAPLLDRMKSKPKYLDHLKHEKKKKKFQHY